MTNDTATFSPESTRRILDEGAHAAGLDASGAELLRLGENALYKLWSPVIVRIARNVDHWPIAVKEVNVARWLGQHRVSAAETAAVSPQPMDVEGHPVTFWRYIDGSVAQPDDIGLLGEVLRELHELPRPGTFSLEPIDMLARVRPRLERAPVPDSDKAMLLRRCDKLRNELDGLDFPLESCATHGDAHIKNLMLRDNQPVLIDFEVFSWGHPEWDLAMTATEYVTAGWWTDDQYRRFADAYGFDITTWSGFSTLRAINEIKMTTWIMQNIEHSETVRAEYETRINSIRTGRHDEPWHPF